jgi:hypothetical protein
MEYKKGKRTFSIKGKGAFNKWMKVHADKRGDRNAYDLVLEITPSAEKVLGKRIVKAAKAVPSTNGKPAKKKPANGRRKPKTAQTTTARAALRGQGATAKPRPANGRRRGARAATARTTAKSPPKNGRRTRRTSTPAAPPKARGEHSEDSPEFSFF